jgi:proline iminopeptidase
MTIASTESSPPAEPVSETFPEPEESGRIAVDGGTLWYRLNGRRHLSAGKTPLLAVHGGPGASHDYLLPLTRLAERRPVILYDSLDCGRSDHPGREQNWTVEHFVAEIAGVRKHLGLKHVALLGSSCGGTWAASYAVTRPAGLEALILASPMLSAPRFVRDAERLKEALPAEVRAAIERHEAQGTTADPEYQNAVRVWYERHVCRRLPWPACVQRMVELFNMDLYGHMWGPSEFTCNGTLHEFDLTPALARIEAPTWYVCGEHDEITPESVREFAHTTPGSRVDVIAESSHMPHVENPLLFDRLAHEFLDAHADE